MFDKKDFRFELIAGKSIIISILLLFGHPVIINAQSVAKKNFGQISLQESVIPLWPGEPGKAPFWNAPAYQFIYAPAFNYKLVPNAVKYNYQILSLADSSSYSFESPVPYSALSKVWASVPVGSFILEVTGISSSGDNLGLAGKGKYFRASVFKGPYYEPVMPYDKSAGVALDSLMGRSYVSYWLTHKSPDPDYDLYRFPSKILSALIVGAVTHAKLKPDAGDVKRSTEIAIIIADYVMSISFQKGTPLGYFPPTYYGYPDLIGKNPNSHMRLNNTIPFLSTDMGNAYLDLYGLTKNEKYLQAAKRIAQTLLKAQLENGSWYFSMSNETGEPTATNSVIPTSIVNYFDRLRRDFKMEGLEKPTELAVKWLMNNPVKTFNWQGQFEDMKAREPYFNQSREQACDFAIYLFKNKEVKVAEELVRFAEDQFVIWEHPSPYIDKSKNNERPSPGWISTNWIAPSVQEQYTYWMPVTRAAGIMIETYWQAYAATKKEIYLAKAKSLANTLTIVQKENNGNYAGYFTKHPMQEWINGIVYPAKTMMALENNIKRLK